ncbi:MAG: cob(I)yrinic acid a,c-diamide adenosyltransferase [Candidatus Neomarinimicrobiota bacterium]
MRISRVTTKTGDRGTTRLGNGQEVGKDHPRIRCLGALDELNAQIGLALAASNAADTNTDLTGIQNDLLNIGGELALVEQAPQLLSADRVRFLEQRLEEMNAQLPPLKEFLLPGGSEFAARLQVARTVCRRAECELVALSGRETVAGDVLQYINRLSDYLFVLARYSQHQSGGGEILWEHPQTD